jgi:hypothetical protein
LQVQVEKDKISSQQRKPRFQGQNFTANEVNSGSKLPALTVTTSTNNLLNTTTDNLNLSTDEIHIPFLVPGIEYASCEQVHDAHGDKISAPLNT